MYTVCVGPAFSGSIIKAVGFKWYAFDVACLLVSEFQLNIYPRSLSFCDHFSIYFVSVK